jgi:hypothetical protein
MIKELWKEQICLLSLHYLKTSEIADKVMITQNIPEFYIEWFSFCPT